MFRFLLNTFLALTLISSPAFADDRSYPAPPTVDVSAIRYLDCLAPNGEEWVGSGFLIADHVLVTALHVVQDAKCIDTDTLSPVTMYKSDPKHDLALATGPRLPTDIPYIKIGCSRFQTGQTYLSWGKTFYGMPTEDTSIMRMTAITATQFYTLPGDTLDDGTPDDGMRIFTGVTAPGTSGGPITNLAGVALGLNNAGDAAYSITYEFADGMLCHK